jgi:membrane protein YqaA with SNARE-associated domain
LRHPAGVVLRQGGFASPGLRAWHLAAFAWGFAEATLFFVVPDVLLSFMAQRRGFRAAALACFIAGAGAALGGLLMRAFGAADPVSMYAVLDAVPAISPEMIASVRESFAADPFGALLAGAFSGVPYKTYAVLAAEISAPAFVAMTLVARAARFLAVTALAAVVDRLLARRLDLRARGLVLGFVWIAFYAFYWTVTPN